MNQLIKKLDKKVMWMGYSGAEFSEDDFKGNVTIGFAGSLLINIDNGDQYKIELEDILNEIKNPTPDLLAALSIEREENKKLKEKFESEAVLLDEQIELTGKKNHEIERLESLNAELLEALKGIVFSYRLGNGIGRDYIEGANELITKAEGGK